MEARNFSAIEAAIIDELKAEAKAAGATVKRAKFRKNSRADILHRELTVLHMMGGVSLDRWAKHGVTYADMVADGHFVVTADRQRKPSIARYKETLR